MKLLQTILIGVLTLTPFWASAEVTSVNVSGFALSFEATTDSSTDDIYKAMTEIGSWWDPAHSWEGKSENLYMDVSICLLYTSDAADD